MVRETGVQSQVVSYQTLKKWYLMLPCLPLSFIGYVSRVKGSNPGNGVAPSPTPWCSSYWKGSLQVILNYGHQLYLLFTSEVRYFKRRVKWRIWFQIPKAGIPLGWTCSKVHREQVDPCSYWVVSKRLETICRKTSKTLRSWDHQVILANMGKRGKIKNEMKVHCSQTTWPIKG